MEDRSEREAPSRRPHDPHPHRSMGPWRGCARIPAPGTLFRSVPSRVSSNAGANAVRLQVRTLIAPPRAREPQETTHGQYGTATHRA